MLPLQARGDLGAMAMKGYYTFPNGGARGVMVIVAGYGHEFKSWT